MKAQVVNTISQLEPHTTHEAGTHLHLNFRRDFGSFRQQRAQPQRMPEATRAYQPGDPLRSIDWRAYARTDQLLINQQQHSANAEVVIAVSCMPAMHWPPADIHHNAVLKLETALRVALHLAFMHSKILDHVTLCLVTDELHTRKISNVTEVLDIYENFCAVNFIYAQLPRVCTFVTGEITLAQLKGDAKYWIGDGLHTAYKTFLNGAPLSCLLHTLSAYELKSDWLNNDSSYFVERESGKESCEAESGKESCEAESGKESGEAESGKESCEAESGKESGEAESGKESGEAESGKESGEAESGKEYQRSRAEQTREALGKNLRRVFRPRLKQWLSATEREIENNGGKYLLLTEDTDIALYLDFLNTHLRFVS